MLKNIPDDIREEMKYTLHRPNKDKQITANSTQKDTSRIKLGDLLLYGSSDNR